DLGRRRRRRRFVALDEIPQPADGEALDEAVGRRRDVALLTLAIDALPEKERLAVLLREVEELPTDEVAAILGSRPATVRVQVSRAREKLRRWMEARRQGGRR